jgi:hypothetical protein
VQGARLDVDRGMQGAALNASAVRNAEARGEVSFLVERIAFQDASRDEKMPDAAWNASAARDAGAEIRRGRQTRCGIRGGVGSPVEGLSYGGLVMMGRRERGTCGGARPRSTVGHAHATGRNREEVSTHVPQLGILSIGWGVCGRRYPPTLHSWVPSSHQESRDRRFEFRKRLWKISSCSSLNSQKEQIFTQSPPAAARKIRRGRARVCRRGARIREFPANHSRGSCGRWAARPGPSPSKNAAELGYAWVRGRDVS